MDSWSAFWYRGSEVILDLQIAEPPRTFKGLPTFLEKPHHWGQEADWPTGTKNPPEEKVQGTSGCGLR